MSYAAQVLRRALRRLVIVQALLVLAAAAVYVLGFRHGLPGGAAVLYGGGIALISTFISAWRLLRATEVAGASATRGMAELYIGAAMRFVSVLALMGVGIAALKLDPLAIIVGFAVAQLGYLFNRVPTDAGHQ
ncbi:MAG: ATP synthase subunit I [Gammaproteobacteria bacterium]|nr:ATP synthase subunit I [Gammaproteobacteria bacterium]